MALVAIQHLFSIEGLNPDAILFGMANPGQTGVTIFCALSGLLSMQSETRQHGRWIARRLWRIYPSYWIVLLGVFSANAVMRYKVVSWDQVVCQFLGIGLFTHGSNLVGVHTWFISLILLCYTIAVVVRWKYWTLPVFVGATVWVMSSNGFIAGHVLSFLAGAFLARSPRSWLYGSLVVIVCLVASHFVHRAFLFPAIGAGG